MTFPTLLDVLADVLTSEPCPCPAGAAPTGRRHHRSVCDTCAGVHAGERELLAEAAAPLRDPECPGLRFDRVMEVLAYQLAQTPAPSGLLATTCCCLTGRPHPSGVPAPRGTQLRPEPGSVVEACLQVFDRFGDPDAMSSEDLVRGLRQMSGRPHGRWDFAELTQRRLAGLLAPYQVHSRDVTLPDGRRRKAYRRTALVAALREQRR
jgi:hypothetical protein